MMNLLDLMVKIGVQDEASGKIGGIASNIVGGLGSAVSGVAKLGAAATAATAGAAVAVGKMSIDSFAQFEQLAGGAELMFGSAYDFIEKRSQEAYKNVQMSQNDYIQQVNGFAVGLKTALGGDEQAAAELADGIVTAEADIVAATGNSAENVQNAFNGIMKGNYSMLDNLGLGINATKEGMQEVIDVVNQHNAAMGEASNYTIDNVADVQRALIDYVDMQGMAGYAANEAAQTLEGASAMVKASWSNLLTELGKDDGDVGARMGELVNSATTYLMGSVDEKTGEVSGGLIPRIQTIISNVATQMPTLLEQLRTTLATVLPQLLDVVVQLLPMVLQVVGQLLMAVGAALPYLFQTVLPVVMEQVLMLINTLTQNMPAMLSAAGQLFGMITEAIATYGPQILEALGNLLVTLVFTLINNVPNMLSAAGELFMAIITAIGEAVPKVLETAGQMLSDLWDKISSFDLAGAAADLVQGIINGISDNIGRVGDVLLGGLQSAVDSALSFLGIASPSKLFDWVGQMSMEGLAGGIEDTAAKAEKATEKAVHGVYGSASGTINADVSAAPANNQILDVLNGIREGMNMSVYLDGKTLVGGIAPTMNTALGRL
jgi:phage-related protein